MEKTRLCVEAGPEAGPQPLGEGYKVCHLHVFILHP